VVIGINKLFNRVRMMSNLYEFSKNSNEKVVCNITNYKGKNYINLRIYFETKQGDWLPIKKGHTFSNTVLPELETAVQKLREAMG